uniref:Uncharacterized protein n=1 Tax=Arundo donax TaxID=35708 RepID=A0A0A9EG16_ARUDO
MTSSDWIKSIKGSKQQLLLEIILQKMDVLLHDELCK